VVNLVQDIPALSQFRVERRPRGLVHLIFDAPGRSMNVFSNEAIQDLGRFAHWFASSDATGALIRSGKASAFCAGADLNELGVAYDTIMAAAGFDRFDVAFKHFFRLSAAIRALESSGKPVAVAIGGLALGGGMEFALGAHYRVLVDSPKAALGLPESLVGLLPGGGGTQRLPRTIGLSASLPILLAGARLAGAAALEAGLVNELVKPGEEVAAAEGWLLANDRATQPWDDPVWCAPSPQSIAGEIKVTRERILAETLGHYPAPLAILDCLEFGLPQGIEGAIRSEMSVFAQLIQRAEPRDMIASLFLGKGDYDRLSKRGEMPDFVAQAVGLVRSILTQHADRTDILAQVGFLAAERTRTKPARFRTTPGLWLDDTESGHVGREAKAILQSMSAGVESLASQLTPQEQRIADYASITQAGYPGYLGGPFAFRRREGRVPGAVTPASR
jgi:3-hydroxyacyl-CoA dehydrogenase/enoyl-CoA hydratase/3-hydroxybutyryl-CoA epimerase